jgi:hypothetical protein
LVKVVPAFEPVGKENSGAYGFAEMQATSLAPIMGRFKMTAYTLAAICHNQIADVSNYQCSSDHGVIFFILSRELKHRN